MLAADLIRQAWTPSDFGIPIVYDEDQRGSDAQWLCSECEACFKAFAKPTHSASCLQEKELIYVIGPKTEEKGSPFGSSSPDIYKQARELHQVAQSAFSPLQI